MPHTQELNAYGSYERDNKHCPATHQKILEISQRANARIEQQKTQCQNRTSDCLITDINQHLNAQLQIGNQIESEQRRAENLDGPSLDVGEFADIYVGDYSGKIDNMEISDLYDFGGLRGEHEARGKLLWCLW